MMCQLFKAAHTIAIVLALVKHVASLPAATYHHNTKRWLTSLTFTGNVHGLTKQDFLVDGTSIPGVPFTVADSYAGTLPASQDKKKHIFFWYHPAETTLGEEDITVWIQGNPTCSSLQGMLQETGPWLLPYGSNTPVINPNSFTNFTHMLYVDYPVGTGFSAGKPPPDSETASIDLYYFFVNFFNIFPALRGNNLWFTGEGYAGTLIERLMYEMLGNRYDLLSDAGINPQGFLFYGPQLGGHFYDVEYAALDFAIRNQQLLGLNDSTILKLQNESDTYNITNFLSHNLQYPPPDDPGFGSVDLTSLSIFEDMTDAIYDVNPCFSFFNAAIKCPVTDDPLGSPPNAATPPTVDNWINNTPGFKKAVHVDPSLIWQECSYGPIAESDSSEPPGTIRLSGMIIDQPSTQGGGNIIVSGEYDMGSLADGVAVLLQLTRWGGVYGFQQPPDESNQLIVDGQPVGVVQQERNFTYVRLPQVGRQVALEAPTIAVKLHKYLLGQIDKEDLYK